MTQKPSIRLYKILLGGVGILNRLFPATLDSRTDLILCYHDISPSSWEFSLSGARFAAQLKFLRSNFTLVGLPEMLRTPNKTARPRIALTFDDGYRSVFNTALPILKRLGHSATVFIHSDPKANPRPPKTGKLLTLGEVKKLVRSGWHIGYHTHSHADLTSLSPRDFKTQVFDHRVKLEKQIGHPLAYLAFPGGVYNRSILTEFKKYNIRRLFTVDGGSAKTASDPLLINRITVPGYLAPADLENLLTPPGLFLNRAFTTLLRLKDQYLNI